MWGGGHLQKLTMRLPVNQAAFAGVFAFEVDGLLAVASLYGIRKQDANPAESGGVGAGLNGVQREAVKLEGARAFLLARASELRGVLALDMHLADTYGAGSGRSGAGELRELTWILSRQFPCYNSYTSTTSTSTSTRTTADDAQASQPEAQYMHSATRGTYLGGEAVVMYGGINRHGGLLGDRSLSDFWVINLASAYSAKRIEMEFALVNSSQFTRALFLSVLARGFDSESGRNSQKSTRDSICSRN